MKAVLDGTYAGSGGKQAIRIVGDLTAEGLSPVDLSDVEQKIKALEEVVLGLQTQIQALQAQNLQASVKELASALESLKSEQTTTVVDPVAATEPPPATTSKKKST